MGLFGPSFDELAKQEIEARKKYVVSHQGEPITKSIDDIKEQDNRQSVINKNIKVFKITIIFIACLIILTVIYSVWIYPIFNDGITLNEYSQIEIGMTYEDVVAVIGKEGKLFLSTDTALGKSSTYTWSSGYGISSATVIFNNSKVSFKSQLGLK
jgi:hypothetical protein